MRPRGFSSAPESEHVEILLRTYDVFPQYHEAPGIQFLLRSDERPSPDPSILKPARPIDEEMFRANMHNLVSTVQAEHDLAFEARAYSDIPRARSLTLTDPFADSTNHEEFAKNMWAKVYAVQKGRDTAHDVFFEESEDDLALLLQREDEMLTSRSKRMFVDSMRTAASVPESSRVPRRPRPRVARSYDYSNFLGAFIYRSVLPTTPVSESLTAGIDVSGKISEQDPEVRVPISHRLRKTYDGTKTVYPVSAVSPEDEQPEEEQPESSQNAGPDFVMASVSDRINMLSLAVQEPVQRARSPWRVENLHRRQEVLNQSLLEYPPKTLPDSELPREK